MLATAVLERPFDWEDHLCHLCMAYNSSVQATTGYTPFYLMLYRQARMPIDVVYGPTPLQTSIPYVSMQQRCKEVWQHTNEYGSKWISIKHDRQKEKYDRRVHGNPFEKGELVWFYSPATPRDQCRKFHQPWSGPYIVIHMFSDVTYCIQMYEHNRKLLWYTLIGLSSAHAPNMHMPDKVCSYSAQQKKNNSPPKTPGQIFN